MATNAAAILTGVAVRLRARPLRDAHGDPAAPGPDTGVVIAVHGWSRRSITPCGR